MKLIYIRSTMEPKNYSTIRSILKKEQGEKIAPYIKINDTQTLEVVFLGSVRSGSSSLNLELEPELEPAHLAVFRTRTEPEPELYLWVRFGFSSKFMNKFGFNHVIRQTLHALKLLNKKNFF